MFHRCVANLASDCTTGPATSPYRRLDLGTAEEGVRASFGEGTEKHRQAACRRQRDSRATLLLD